MIGFLKHYLLEESCEMGDRDMAVEKISMPQLGESVTEGTLERWLVKPGDQVKKYDPIAEVITDKVNAEIPSSYEGVVDELLIDEGATVEVGTNVCTILTNEVNNQQNQSTISKSVEKHSNVTETTTTTNEIVHSVQMNTRYSPSVLKLASENNVDLSLVDGTGHLGRVTRKDVLDHIASNVKGNEKANNHSIPTIQSSNQPKFDHVVKMPEIDFEAGTIRTANGDIELPVSQIRSRIAKNMTRSKHEIPHAWMMIEVDVTNLVAYRQSIKDEFLRNEGFPLTYFAFFAKVVSQALKEFPMINSTWAEDKIIIRKDVNLSIAVGVDEELYVPVIKNADEKTIKGIAKDIYELSQLAKQRQLKLSHITGGTFTLNNTGSFGSIASNGIINHPQAAILQIESIVKKPVIIGENMIAPRDIVNICMSLDHRILDGLICGKFLNRVKYLLESVNNETMSVY